MGEQKAYAAFVVLVVGLFLLLEGTRLDPAREIAVDATLMVIGAVLTLAYFFLIGDYLQRRLGAPAIVTPMPVLLVLGAVMVYQSALRPIEIVSKTLFGVFGIVLILASAFVLYRARGKAHKTTRA